MPQLECAGNGYDALCGYSPLYTHVKITDAAGNTITEAYPGDIVYIKARIQGNNIPCSNFYLMFYGRQAEYLGCYQDRVTMATHWWVAWPFGVPNYPGTTITVGALENLTGVLLTTPLTILQPPVACEDITNATLCVQSGCYWYNNSCHTQLVCEDITTQAECGGQGCYWYNNSCHATAPSCETINNESDCTTYGCFWYNNSCHSTPAACSPEGSTQCFGYDLYTCTGGQWVLTEPNSPSCGYVPPVCTEGDTKCEGYDLYTCIGGQWVLTEQNSSACGYTPPSEECEQHTTQATCEAAGCYWYAHPNPFGEPSCHDKEILQAYLPIIIIGVGGAILLAAVLIPSRKPAPLPPTYYPPPPPPSYYPPSYYPPPRR